MVVTSKDKIQEVTGENQSGSGAHAAIFNRDVGDHITSKVMFEQRCDGSAGMSNVDIRTRMFQVERTSAMAQW